ncbi:hypothetical protein [Aminobacter niigataensis]|uniref:hypothetical protein n=1 Tax=Aminobacter niigataensis TaxID=83265 RepID=UPI00298ED894|nr:hypothetical protein [Aminobacter niigataensis]
MNIYIAPPGLTLAKTPSRMASVRRGAGPGLNLVHEIMQIHGDRIELACGEQRGARFRMVFPSDPAA